MAGEPSTDDRIVALEARLRRVEDLLAITQLVASYGPLVDAGDADRDGFRHPTEPWQVEVARPDEVVLGVNGRLHIVADDP